MPESGRPMALNVDIGFAKVEELPVMADLLHELFTLEGDFTPECAKQLAGLAMIHADPAYGRLFALRVEGQLAGMASLLLLASTAEGGRVGLLEDVIVAPPWRGRGLGAQLLERVCAWASSQNLRRLTLLADPDNLPALVFYARQGFVTSTMTVRRKYL